MTELNGIEYITADVRYANDLVELWTDSFTQAYKGAHSKENLRSYCEVNYTLHAAKKILNDQNFVCTIATKSGKQVGISVVQHHHCPLKPNTEASELKHLYLLSSQYGTGLGRSLLEHSFETVRDTGYKWIWLCVSDLNHRARGFYRKVGFKPIGEGPILKVGSDRLTSTIMMRQI